jgi:hypothetical protein
MVRTFLQVTSLLLTIEAAVFLARSGLALSPEAIAELAATKVTYNPNLLASFSSQRADTFVGVVLLFIGFLLQMANALWSMRIDEFSVHKGAAGYALVFSLVVAFGAFYASREIAGYTQDAAKRVLAARIAGQK